MEKLTLKQFDRRAEKYNLSVAGCPGIDPFCTRTDWIIPFYKAFTPESPAFIWHHNESYVVFSENTSPDGEVFLTALEAMWGFPSPLVGQESLDMLEQLLAGDCPEADIDKKHLLLPGLPDGHPVARRIAEAAASHYEAFLIEPTQRCIASLEGGVDGFLRRRSGKFRTGLRKALQRTAEHDIAFQRVQTVQKKNIPKTYERILAVERLSWKGLSGRGIDQPPMELFYRHMLPRIAPEGQLRLIFAERAGETIGYIFGTTIGKHYRGLQFSFDQRFASLSLGNVLQYRMIEWLCEEGCLRYDLGCVVPYKIKWADGTHKTLTVYLRPL